MNVIDRRGGSTRRTSIKEVAVAGVPDEDWREAVMIGVAPREADQLEVQEVKLFSDEKLADYEVPKWVKIVDELPRTPYGKADKHASCDPCWEDTQGRNDKRERGDEHGFRVDSPLR